MSRRRRERPTRASGPRAPRSGVGCFVSDYGHWLDQGPGPECGLCRRLLWAFRPPVIPEGCSLGDVPDAEDSRALWGRTWYDLRRAYRLDPSVLVHRECCPGSLERRSALGALIRTAGMFRRTLDTATDLRRVRPAPADPITWETASRDLCLGCARRLMSA